MTRPVSCVVLLALAVGCGRPSDEVPDDTGQRPDAGGDVGAEAGVDAGSPPECPTEATLQTREERVLEGVGSCTISLSLEIDTLAEVVGSESVALTLDDTNDSGEPNWLEPALVTGGEHALGVEADGEWSVTVETFGPPVSTIDRDRSLVWTDPALVDDPEVIGLGRLMEIAADGDDPGLLFADWLERFATTAHSERVGPLQFLDEIEQTHGDDPTTWDLDALAFAVTGVHNRVDLATDNSCGELRVSIASTHQIYQPFHAIFLFDQRPGDGDVSPGGMVHCGATHRRWARLSELDEAEFRSAATQLLDEALEPETFLMAETVEFIISPWEWRQWVPTPTEQSDAELTRVFENPPLFQTIDTPRLNQEGSTRDAFLQFVEENASELDARTTMLPERFRPRSARVNAGVPWVPVDLSGVSPGVLDDYPDLRRNIEMMGCPACHATDAEFIQTRPDRTFSPFYDKELDARAEYLGAAQQGDAPEVPFGPLQESPILPP